VSGGESLRVPEEFEAAQAVYRLEFVIGMGFEPAKRLIGFPGKVRDIDLAVSNLPLAGNRVSAS
jgi:hypothetical protein